MAWEVCCKLLKHWCFPCLRCLQIMNAVQRSGQDKGPMNWGWLTIFSLVLWGKLLNLLKLLF